MTGTDKKPSPPSPKDERKERLAKALRENLLRRKAAATPARKDA